MTEFHSVTLDHNSRTWQACDRHGRPGDAKGGPTHHQGRIAASLSREEATDARIAYYGMGHG